MTFLRSLLLIVKGGAKSIILPGKIEKKSKFIGALLWLCIASISLVGGAIVGFISRWELSGIYLLDVWCTWSLMCGIPFSHIIIKYAYKIIRAGGKFGKSIQYEETTVNSVGPPSPNYTLYEIKKEKRNLGWLFALLAGLLFGVFAICILYIFGVVLVAYKIYLTVLAVVSYSKEANKENNSEKLTV